MLDIIIATYNRKDDLKVCIESILNQEELPDNLIIVDSSDKNDDREEIRNYVSSINLINIIYITTNEKGSSVQRNIGLDKISKNCKVVTFLDDDIVLEKNYIAEIKKAFKDSNIVGISGFLFKDGQTVNTLPDDTTKRITDSLYGCNMSFRRNAIGDIRFDENLRLYAFMEDWDFSYRVGKKGNLYFIYGARAIHNASPKGRINNKKFGFMLIANRYYVYKKNNILSLNDYVYFIMCILKNCILSFKKSRREKAIGAIIGFYKVVLLKKDISLMMNL